MFVRSPSSAPTQVLATASDDKMVRLFDLANGKEIAKMAP